MQVHEACDYVDRPGKPPGLDMVPPLQGGPPSLCTLARQENAARHRPAGVHLAVPVRRGARRGAPATGPQEFIWPCPCAGVPGGGRPPPASAIRSMARSPTRPHDPRPHRIGRSFPRRIAAAGGGGTGAARRPPAPARRPAPRRSSSAKTAPGYRPAPARPVRD